MLAFAIIIYRWFLMAFQPLFALPSGSGGLPSDDAEMASVEPHSPSSSSQSNNETLATRVAELEAMMRQPSTQYVSTPKESKINSPSPFKGNKAEAEEFILKCQAIFDICTRTYFNDNTKLAFVFNLLQGDAYQWVKPALLATDKEKPAWVQTWKDFKVEFFKYFADSDVKEVARQNLKALKQTGSASTYATEFKKYALYLECTDETLRQWFFDGLKIRVQDRLLSPQRFTTYTELVDSAIEWDNLLHQRSKAVPTSRNYSSTYAVREIPRTPAVKVHKTVETSVKGPWPMDVDSVQPRKPLTQAEKDYRKKNGLCLYCGKPGHTLANCRSKPAPQKLSAIEGKQASGKENPHQ
jgi:hypothetical protein